MPRISSLGVMNAINFGLASPAKLQCILVTQPSKVDAYNYGSNFGTKLAKSFSNAVNLRHVAVDSGGNYVAACNYNGTPYINICSWSKTLGFGTSFSSPATMPPASTYSSGFSQDGSLYAVGFLSSPYIYMYPFGPSGFGTKFANPVTLPSGNVTAVSFAGNTIVGTNTGLYQVSSSGFGSAMTSLASVVAATFNSDGSSFAVSTSVTPYFTIYNHSNGILTNASSSSPALTNYATPIAYAIDNSSIACREQSTSALIAFNISNGVLGTKYTNTANTYSSSLCYDFTSTSILAASSSTLYKVPFSTSGFGTISSGPIISTSPQCLARIS